MRHTDKPYRLFWPKLPPQRVSITAFLKNGNQYPTGRKSRQKIGGSPVTSSLTMNFTIATNLLLRKLIIPLSLKKGSFFI